MRVTAAVNSSLAEDVSAIATRVENRTTAMRIGRMRYLRNVKTWLEANEARTDLPLGLLRILSATFSPFLFSRLLKCRSLRSRPSVPEKFSYTNQPPSGTVLGRPEVGILVVAAISGCSGQITWSVAGKPVVIPAG
jgi:hypothetical protein